jgi:acyl carrier protein
MPDQFASKAASKAAGKEMADAEKTAALMRIWHEVLGVPVEPDDDFFDLGGDSFEAVRILTRIRNELGCDISPVELFDRPTIEELVPIMTQFPA